MDSNVKKRTIIDALYELSGKYEQFRLWLSPGYPEVSSYIESIERLFTDSGLSDDIDRNVNFYPTHINEKFVELRILSRTMDLNRNPIELISDTRMQMIREKATELIILLQNL